MQAEDDGTSNVLKTKQLKGNGKRRARGGVEAYRGLVPKVRVGRKRAVHASPFVLLVGWLSFGSLFVLKLNP